MQVQPIEALLTTLDVNHLDGSVFMRHCQTLCTRHDVAIELTAFDESDVLSAHYDALLSAVYTDQFEWSQLPYPVFDDLEAWVLSDDWIQLIDSNMSTQRVAAIGMLASALAVAATLRGSLPSTIARARLIGIAASIRLGPISLAANQLSMAWQYACLKQSGSEIERLECRIVMCWLWLYVGEMAIRNIRESVMKHLPAGPGSDDACGDLLGIETRDWRSITTHLELLAAPWLLGWTKGV